MAGAASCRWRGGQRRCWQRVCVDKCCPRQQRRLQSPRKQLEGRCGGHLVAGGEGRGGEGRSAADGEEQDRARLVHLPGDSRPPRVRVSRDARASLYVTAGCTLQPCLGGEASPRRRRLCSPLRRQAYAPRCRRRLCRGPPSAPSAPCPTARPTRTCGISCGPRTRPPPAHRALPPHTVSAIAYLVLSCLSLSVGCVFPGVQVTNY